MSYIGIGINTANSKSRYWTHRSSDPWIAAIIYDHRIINSHISDAEYKLYYLPVLLTILSPTYTDDSDTGYFYNTFGKSGLNRSTANFFILYLFNNNISASGSMGFFGGTFRQDLEGEIFNVGTKPAHIYTGAGYWIISSDNFSGVTAIYHANTFLVKYVPSYYYMPATFNLWINANSLEGVFSINNSKTFSGTFQIQDNKFTGVAPKITANYRINTCQFTDIDLENTVFTTALASIRVETNFIETERLDLLFSMLNTFFSGTAPVRNLLMACEGVGQGFVTGVKTEGVWSENTDIVNLRALFVAAGYTLTLTYNSDEFAWSEDIVVFTFDDAPLVDYTVGFPLFSSYGIKGTIFANGSTVPAGLTWANAVYLHSLGWDIQCHGYNHAHEKDLSDADVALEMTLNNDAFIANGLPSPEHHAFPFYESDAECRAVISNYRHTARAGAGSIGAYWYVYKDADLMLLNSVYGDIVSESDLARTKLVVDGAKRRKGLLLISLHSPKSGYGYDPVYLGRLIDYIINTKGFTCLTMKQFWDTYGTEFV